MTTTTASITAATAADLRATREQWGDLLAAINTRPAAEWPPRDSRALGVEEHPADDETPLDHPQVGRLPLTLREHPAPLNLDALDAAMAIEVAVFDLADQLAETCQRPIRRVLTGRYWDHRDRQVHAAWGNDEKDANDPARWHHQTLNGPGSRAYGLHWAAVWCEGRLLGEDGDSGLFRPVGVRQLDEAHDVASRARARLERALNRDTRTTVLPAGCPWCGSRLIGRNTGGDPSAAVVWCTGGRACGAHTELDPQGRRTWQGAALTGLYGALAGKARRTASA